MGKIKEQFIEEINKGTEDLDYQYQLWLEEEQEKAIIEYYEENEEKIKGELILRLTNYFTV